MNPDPGSDLIVRFEQACLSRSPTSLGQTGTRTRTRAGNLSDCSRHFIRLSTGDSSALSSASTRKVKHLRCGRSDRELMSRSIPSTCEGI